MNSCLLCNPCDDPLFGTDCAASSCSHNLCSPSTARASQPTRWASTRRATGMHGPSWRYEAPRSRHDVARVVTGPSSPCTALPGMSVLTLQQPPRRPPSPRVMFGTAGPDSPGHSDVWCEFLLGTRIARPRDMYVPCPSSLRAHNDAYNVSVHCADDLRPPCQQQQSPNHLRSPRATARPGRQPSLAIHTISPPTHPRCTCSTHRLRRSLQWTLPLCRSHYSGLSNLCHTCPLDVLYH